MPVAEPITRRWTRQEYYRMAADGYFEGQRVELIGGEIVVMSPQNFRHGSGLERIARVVERAFGPKYWVRTQQPLNLSLDSSPEPDVYVVTGSPDDYSDHPRRAALVIEVSDTTLAFDRGRKASLYARGRVADYWIVNLLDHQLEVYRAPVSDKTQQLGFRYGSRTILNAGNTISPLAKPKVEIQVRKLLPPEE